MSHPILGQDQEEHILFCCQPGLVGFLSQMVAVKENIEFFLQTSVVWEHNFIFYILKHFLYNFQVLINIIQCTIL